MKAVLIIWLVLGGHNAATSSQVLYTSRESCEAAAIVLRAHTALPDNAVVITACVDTDQ